MRSADGRSFLRQLVTPGGLVDEPEIDQLGHVEDDAAFAENDVGRLDVAMDEADRVGLAEGVQT